MFNLQLKEIIGGTDDETLTLSDGDVLAIQMAHEYMEKMEKHTKKPEVFHLKNRPVLHERLSVKEQLKFYKQWYDSPLVLKDLLKQFGLEEEAKTRIKHLTNEMVQRISYIQTILSNQSLVVAFNPFSETSNANIHLFHKMMQQLVHSKKSLLVVTTRTEEAFIVKPDIYTLKADGLKAIFTEEEENTDAPTKLKVKVDDKTIFVNVEDIDYIESNEGKVFINVEREKFVYDLTLKNAEEKMSGFRFYRCHRSYLVNLYKVKEIITWSKNSYSLVIDNHDEVKIPLSRTKYGEIQELLVHL